jgi:PAS domain-containing protein
VVNIAKHTSQLHLLTLLAFNNFDNFQFQNMQGYQPSWAFSTNEVSDEFNFLNEFLNTSLLDDGALAGGELSSTLPDNLLSPMLALTTDSGRPASEAVPDTNDKPSTRLVPKAHTDKATEKYYMTAADPSGTDAPEERMRKLLQAKYEAGLLKPFNYVKGYARLNTYMEKNLEVGLRQRILRQLDQFRPKFRERMQRLTDMELIMVEMWFERKLMEYDRVFASMAIPACLWRRTGEIFRGNREMAELIHVPVEHLRDGKLSIHEIFVADSLVSYWERFGSIAFETSQKAMLTSCILHSPPGVVTGRDKYKDIEKDGTLKCCFSFTIIRDAHSM